MIGFLRPLLRYASPTALMKRTGEIVLRFEPGRSSPRGETARPITSMLGLTAWVFRGVLEQYPSISQKMLVVLASRLRNATKPAATD